VFRLEQSRDLAGFAAAAVPGDPHIAERSATPILDVPLLRIKRGVFTAVAAEAEHHGGRRCSPAAKQHPIPV
jgi:hypothetical protein